ncbi:MAG: hypothetical protein JRC87_06225 [Deltaproteobacteria bacterium]|nr:hypothetical protein [Deltaproteobacteria bacterium]
MIPSLEYTDRYYNEGTRTYSSLADYTEADEQYRPNSTYDSFSLVPLRVPKSQVNIYSANPSPQLFNRYIYENEVLFCIHPQVLLNFKQDPYIISMKEKGEVGKRAISVVPSSSTRTLYVLDDGDISHALKVHFPFRISRYGRKMRDEVIGQAINISLELEEGIKHLDDDFAFLREVLGVSHKNLDILSARNENWGYLVRDMRPFPHVSESRTLLPGFALYGRNFFDPEKPPLLYQLIGNENPLDFVLGNIMLPIIRHWVDCFLRFGYMLEPHGQNVLLELNESGGVERIVHRDLSVGIDMRRRRQIGLSQGNLNNYNRMESGEFNSITYDMFMGGHFFDAVVSCCLKRYPQLTVEDFRAPCRQLFAEIFPEYRKFLPATVHYFSEKRDQFNKPLYKDTGKSPEWRP